MRPTFLLEVLSGPLDGTTWHFEREIVIGRDEEHAEACIPVDRYVSRRHARLHSRNGKVFLADLESRNGTRSGERAVAGEEALDLGSPFQVGRTILRVTRR